MERPEYIHTAAAPRSRGSAAVRVARGVLCMALSLIIAFVPVDVQIGASGARPLDPAINSALHVHESKAEALVPVAAGGAAALAAAIGVSEAELVAGLIGILAVGTGVSMQTIDPNAFGAMWDSAGNAVSDLATNTQQFSNQVYKDAVPPGYRGWDDLTSEEQAAYGTAANYARNCWEDLSIQTELGYYNNGGIEPTPEPDDPDKKKKWQKGRNILTVLGLGGAVAAGEAVGWLADSLADGVKQFLFGASDLGLKYEQKTSINGEEVLFVTASPHVNNQNINYNNWIWGSYGIYTTAEGLTQQFNSKADGTYPTVVVNAASNNTPYMSFTFQFGTRGGYMARYRVNGAYVGGAYFASSGWRNTTTAYGDEELRNFLNADYGGVYEFPNGSRYSQGTWVGTIPETDVQYGQILGTPNDVVRNILDAAALKNAMNAYEDVGDGTKRAVVLPDYYVNPQNQPAGDVTVNYQDWIQTKPSEQVEPVPDDKPVDPSTVNPVPGWNFPSELNDAIENLGTNSLGQLFPFCLITDLKRLTDMVTTSVGGSGDYSKINVGLSDFGVDGMNNMELDLTPILSLGNLCRPVWNLVFLVALVAESIRYFLK